MNGKIRELFKKVKKDCEISFFTVSDPIGHKAYVRTAVMLMIKAMQDVAGEGMLERVKVEFAIGPGYYCSVKGNIKLDADFIDRLNRRMGELVAADLPYIKKILSFERGGGNFPQPEYERKGEAVPVPEEFVCECILPGRVL